MWTVIPQGGISGSESSADLIQSEGFIFKLCGLFTFINPETAFFLLWAWLIPKNDPVGCRLVYELWKKNELEVVLPASLRTCSSGRLKLYHLFWGGAVGTCKPPLCCHYMHEKRWLPVYYALRAFYKASVGQSRPCVHPSVPPPLRPQHFTNPRWLPDFALAEKVDNSRCSTGSACSDCCNNWLVAQDSVMLRLLPCAPRCCRCGSKY